MFRRIRTRSALSRWACSSGVRDDFDRDRMHHAVDVNSDHFGGAPGCRAGDQQQQGSDFAHRTILNITPRKRRGRPGGGGTPWAGLSRPDIFDNNWRLTEADAARLKASGVVTLSPE